MSQLWEYIEKTPAETQRLVGINFDQLMGLITHAENLHTIRKSWKKVRKPASSKLEVVGNLN